MRLMMAREAVQFGRSYLLAKTAAGELYYVFGF